MRSYIKKKQEFIILIIRHLITRGTCFSKNYTNLAKNAKLFIFKINREIIDEITQNEDI